MDVCTRFHSNPSNSCQDISSSKGSKSVGLILWASWMSVLNIWTDRTTFPSLGWNISTTIEWFVMKSCTDMHDPRRITFAKFSDPVTFVAPPTGQSFHQWHISTSRRRIGKKYCTNIHDPQMMYPKNPLYTTCSAPNSRWTQLATNWWT